MCCMEGALEAEYAVTWFLFQMYHESAYTALRARALNQR